MILILTIAGAALATVLVYVRLRHRDPKAAELAAQAVRQLAAVILVCTRAIEGLEAALAPKRPQLVYPGRRAWAPSFDEEEDE